MTPFSSIDKMYLKIEAVELIGGTKIYGVSWCRNFDKVDCIQGGT
jgi:hypothetical protein